MMKSLPLSKRVESDTLKKPKELFSYSRGLDGKWELDEAASKTNALSHFYFPDSYLDRHYNLQGGIQNFKKIPEAENVAGFPLFLSGIIHHEQKSGKRIKADIITFRGIMTRILTLHQDLNSPIDLYAIAYDGQIFIKNNDELTLSSKEKEQEALKADPAKERHMKICEYAGYKFEALTTLPKPWAQCTRKSIENRYKNTVNNYEQYISVVRSGIGSIKTVVAGEVDCIWDYAPEGRDYLPHYAELKTSRIAEKPGQLKTFEKKLHKTWAQCFLLGITKIVYGYRDDGYLLRNIEVFDTEEVPVLLQKSELAGSKINCLDSLKWYGAALEWITQIIDRADELKAYKILYDPGTRTFLMSECDPAMNKKLREGELLTDEFRAWRDTLRTR